MINVPELDRFSGSWVVSHKDGSVVGEFFERSNVECFDSEKCIAETSHQYLTRINRQVKEKGEITDGNDSVALRD